MKKRVKDAYNPNIPLNPILLIKNIDAPSLMPNSPKETGGITVFANITRIPAIKN